VTLNHEDKTDRFARFLEAVEQGATWKEALTASGCSWGGVTRWLADERNVTADGATFAQRYAHARSMSAGSWADRATQVAADAQPDTVQVAKLQHDAYKWRAAMADPKAWGDRKQLEVSGSVAHLHLAALQSPRAATIGVIGAHALPEPEQIPYAEPVQGE